MQRRAKPKDTHARTNTTAKGSKQQTPKKSKKAAVCLSRFFLAVRPTLAHLPRRHARVRRKYAARPAAAAAWCCGGVELRGVLAREQGDGEGEKVRVRARRAAKKPARVPKKERAHTNTPRPFTRLQNHSTSNVLKTKTLSSTITQACRAV